MKILIFLEGNVLQSETDFTPIKEVGKKLTTWIENGGEVEFLTRVHKFTELKKLDDTLKDLGVDHPKIHAMPEGENCCDSVEEIEPNIFIENKENSGTEKLISDKLDPAMKIGTLVLEPRQGLDLLPDNLEELKLMTEEEAVAPAAAEEM